MTKAMRNCRDWCRRYRYIVAVTGVFLSGLTLGAGGMAVSSDRAVARVTAQYAQQVATLQGMVEASHKESQGWYEAWLEATAQYEARLQRLTELAERSCPCPLP